ncbi:hypothetical protein [Virgibacillus sediminis]|uniref:Uncharacterized protein n=1 Tax=Virgibacillus sediminis TaxID=202260 RepID=A0ABV7A1I8_9BACI
MLKEMHMYFGDLDYEMNRLKVKILTYEGYLEGLGQGDLIMDELYLKRTNTNLIHLVSENPTGPGVFLDQIKSIIDFQSCFL